MEVGPESLGAISQYVDYYLCYLITLQWNENKIISNLV